MIFFVKLNGTNPHPLTYLTYGLIHPGLYIPDLLKQVQLELVVRQSLAINKVAAAVTRGCRETANDF